MVGVALFMGGETTYPGSRAERRDCVRLSGAILKEEFRRGGAAAAFAAALHARLCPTNGADGRLQPASLVVRQICRWLLSLDRLSSTQ
jgi:hypothetical protein